MKKTTLLLSVFTLSLFIFSGCKKTNTAIPLTASEIAFAKSQLQIHTDSLTVKWAAMVEDDDDKLASMKRLLEEVSYTNEYNEEQFNVLTKEVEAIKGQRYDWQSMADSNIIDDYDIKSDALIGKVLAFAQNHPQFENYSLMQQLVSEIQDADNRVFFHRLGYDDIAKNYNLFLQNNVNAFEQANLPALPTKRSLFQISE